MKMIIALLISIFILSGCTNENTTPENAPNEYSYNFTGSSENWEASYEVDIIDKKQGETQRDEEGMIRFIGEDEAPEMIDYKLETENGVDSSAGTGAPIYDNVGYFSQGSCTNCVAPIKEDKPIKNDAEVELEIIWDGKSEKIVLTLDE